MKASGYVFGYSRLIYVTFPSLNSLIIERPVDQLEERKVWMKSFDEIYQQYFQKLYFFLLKLSGDKALSEELTQETMYKAFLHIDQFEERSSLYSWLCKIAKNNWLTEISKNSHKYSLDAMEKDVEVSGFEDETVELELKNLLRRELLKLPEPYQTVCILKIYAELSHTEIAKIHHKSESWAKVTFFRGKTMLMERMEKYE